MFCECGPLLSEVLITKAGEIVKTQTVNIEKQDITQ